jgi:phosphoglycolate phosphatase-like HAD superfamily hydrolase
MNVIFDLDGTLSDATAREHFLKQDPPDWQSFFFACGSDRPVEPMIALLKALDFDNAARPESQRHFISIWTGRPERLRDVTVRWLKRHGIRLTMLHELRMRDDDDYTAGYELKRRWLHEQRDMPDLVFEDNPDDVAMWREEGIYCLHIHARGIA